MKKLLLFIGTISPLMILCQVSKQFEIVGTSSFYNNQEIRLDQAVWDTAYNDIIIEKNAVLIKANGFSIKGDVKYPTPLWFSCFKKEERRVFVSDLLFVEEGNIKVNLNDFSTDKEFGNQLKSKSNLEYQKLRALYKHLEANTLTGIEEKDVQKRDKIIEGYIRNNPNSYVALWILIRDYSNFGYTELIENISSLFSNDVKSTKTFKTFAKRIAIDKTVSINKEFPFHVFDFGEDLKRNVQQSRYTLIDFWASYCEPCIAQFPNLSKIYANYHVKGFNIYGIAINSKDDNERMESLIKSNGITWSNVLDDNGNASKKINVEGIPKNFLLDAEGKILAKNIELSQLENFLKEKLP